MISYRTILSLIQYVYKYSRMNGSWGEILHFENYVPLPVAAQNIILRGITMYPPPLVYFFINLID